MAITVDYDELVGSPTEELTFSGAVVHRQLICDWADRLTLAKELLGWTVGGVLHPPDLYDPEGDEPLYSIYARDCTVEPFIAPSDVSGSSYKKAKLTVIYRTPEYTEAPPAGETVYISESLEPAAEFLTLNRKGFYFGTGASKVSLEENDLEAPAKIDRMIDWVYTIHRVPTLITAYFDLPGKVNNAAVYSRSLNITFPAETLLCGNPSLSREITSTGITAWTITFRFTYKNSGTIASPLGWNYFPRTDNADSGGINYEQITDGTDAIPIYTLADFSTVVL